MIDDLGRIGVGGIETGEMVRLDVQPLRLVSNGGGRRYECVLVTAGRVKRRDGKPSNWVISPDALQAAVERFAGVAVFVDHPGFFDMGRSVRDLAGMTGSDVRFVANELQGTIRLYEDGPGAWVSALFDQMLADKAAGNEVPDVGLSAVFWHRTEIVDDDRVTTEFTHVESVDVVFGPGAKGAVRAALQAVDGYLGLDISEARAKAQGGKIMDKDEKVVQQPEGGGDGALPAATDTVVVEDSTEESGGLSLVTGPDLELRRAQEEALRQERERQHQLQVGQCQAFLDMQLRVLSQELPQASIDHIKKQFIGKVFEPAALTAAVAEQRELLAAIAERRAVRDMGVITSAQTGLDRLTRAYEQLMGLPGNYDGVERLTGLKEWYILMTGDRECKGVFVPERAMLATDTSTMAEVTRNVLNKVLLNQWVILGEAGYNWWERVCHIEDFTSLQQISWVTVDGFSDLSTVTEGSAYAEISWDDARETADWTKKGGYVGLTLEMIDRDDVGAWRAVPRGLATAGIRTLSAAVAALFTSNDGVGPALADTYYLFDATNHSNLITQPLDPDNWDTAVQTMFKQTEAGSSKRLGIRPRYLLVPIEKEKKARQVLGSSVEPVSGVFYENVRQTAQDNVITVPEWTDADNWAAMADPAIAPGIGVGFRWGRVPELFTVTSSLSGLMFTNDILPIKVRYMYAAGVINYRAMVKSNCAG